MKPTARTERILTEEIDDELLAYDQDTNRAHRLNKTAAVVWKHCDGERDVPALAAILRAEVGDSADENLVQITLDQLSANGLLDGEAKRSAEEARLSRRQFVRKVGVVGAAALLLPIVKSIVAPTPAAAQTCGCECPCECECCPCGCECPCIFCQGGCDPCSCC